MKKLFIRNNYLSKIRGFYDATDLIKVITGIRRCGKSSIMQMIKDEIVAKYANESNIIDINLDKRGYRTVTTADKLDDLIQSLCEGKEGIKYLFIDEIQNVKDFELVLNGYREEEEYSIFITGSNSYLLSGELMTKLTGRYITFEIFPLTFYEYIEMKKFYRLAVDPNLNTEFNNYANEGGFPRTILFENLTDKRNYVKELINEIFEKDIRSRVVIRKKETFDLIRNYLINNYGATTSINNIFTELNKNGFIIGKATLTRYIQALVNAKILYPCSRFDMKSKRMFSGEKKYYLADLSFTFITNPDSRINYGQVLENTAYIYFRSMDYEISIGKIGKLECDFILKDNFLNYAYAQICYTILSSIDTENREYAPLEKIRDNYPKYVLTCDTLLQRRNGIIHQNLLQWMSENKKI